MKTSYIKNILFAGAVTSLLFCPLSAADNTDLTKAVVKIIKKVEKLENDYLRLNKIDGLDNTIDFSVKREKSIGIEKKLFELQEDVAYLKTSQNQVAFTGNVTTKQDLTKNESSFINKKIKRLEENVNLLNKEIILLTKRGTSNISLSGTQVQKINDDLSNRITALESKLTNLDENININGTIKAPVATKQTSGVTRIEVVENVLKNQNKEIEEIKRLQKATTKSINELYSLKNTTGVSVGQCKTINCDKKQHIDDDIRKLILDSYKKQIKTTESELEDIKKIIHELRKTQKIIIDENQELKAAVKRLEEKELARSN